MLSFLKKIFGFREKSPAEKAKLAKWENEEAAAVFYKNLNDELQTVDGRPQPRRPGTDWICADFGITRQELINGWMRTYFAPFPDLTEDDTQTLFSVLSSASASSVLLVTPWMHLSTRLPQVLKPSGLNQYQ